MDKMLDIVQYWYDRNEGEFSYDNQLFYLIELFQDLKQEGLDKESLPKVAERLIFLLDLDMVDDGLYLIYQRMLAEEISNAFRIVNKDVKTFKDEPKKIEQVVKIDDGDIYPNNTSEPDIDLRGVEFEQIPDDIEFLKELGIEKWVKI